MIVSTFSWVRDASADNSTGLRDASFNGVVTLFEGGRMGPLAPAVQAS